MIVVHLKSALDCARRRFSDTGARCLRRAEAFRNERSQEQPCGAMYRPTGTWLVVIGTSRRISDRSAMCGDVQACRACRDHW